MKKAILYIFAFLAIQFVAQFLVVTAYVLITRQPIETMSPLWNIAMMVLFSVATIVVFLKAGWFQVSRRYIRSHPWDVLAWSVVASLGALVPSMLVQGLIPEWSGWAKELVEQSNAQLEGLMSVPGGYMVIALLPPVVEEMVLRGCVLKSLLQWRPSNKWAMIALSAFFFALVHLNPAQMPHAFLIGLLLGWMYYRTGSILPGVAFHWVNNTVAYVMYNLYPDPEMTFTKLFGGQKTVVAAVLFSLLILLPAIYQLHLRMRKAA